MRRRPDHRPGAARRGRRAGRAHQDGNLQHRILVVVVRVVVEGVGGGGVGAEDIVQGAQGRLGAARRRGVVALGGGDDRGAPGERRGARASGPRSRAAVQDDSSTTMTNDGGRGGGRRRAASDETRRRGARRRGGRHGGEHRRVGCASDVRDRASTPARINVRGDTWPKPWKGGTRSSKNRSTSVRTSSQVPGIVRPTTVPIPERSYTHHHASSSLPLGHASCTSCRVSRP